MADLIANNESGASVRAKLNALYNKVIHSNTIIVDGLLGVDADAIIDNTLPFKTISAAKAAAIAGTLIIVYPGTYNEYDIAKNGISYYFMPGAIVNYDGSVFGAVIFNDNETAMTMHVIGSGQFLNYGTGGNNDVIKTKNVATLFYIEGFKMYSDKNRLSANYIGYQKITAHELKAKDGVIDLINNTAGTAETFVIADHIISLTGFCLEHDGGKLTAKCNTLTSLGAVACITTATGNGTMTVDCNEINSQDIGIDCSNVDTILKVKNAKITSVGANYYAETTNTLFLQNCTNADNSEFLTGNKKANFIDSRGYVTYSAVLSQLGTADPTPVIMENNIGSIAWTRSDTGIAIGTLVGKFIENNVIINVLASGSYNDSVCYASRLTDDTIQINNFYLDAGALIPNDDFIISIEVKIKI